MKLVNSMLLSMLIIIAASSEIYSQSLVYSDGSTGNCPGFPSGCTPQPNYGVSSNTATGEIFLLKTEFSNATGLFHNKLIKYPGPSARTGEINLRSGTYKSVLAESGTGTGVFVFFTKGDSVIVERYNQGTLAKNFSTGIFTGAGSTEAVDIMVAHNSLYIASNDNSGLHIRRLNKTTGAIISSVNYNTSFSAAEHALDMDATSSGIILAGYLSRPGTIYGDEFWTIKFTVGLAFNWQKLYNNNLSVTNNSDRAAKIHVNNDSIYVAGTSTRPTGDVDALLWKYTNTGINRWFKLMNKGWVDFGVDCAIDPSNNDVYLLQNATIGTGQALINTTAGSNIITFPGGIPNFVAIGMSINCQGPIPPGSSVPPTVIAIMGANTIVISANATVSMVGVMAYFNAYSKIFVTRYNSSGTYQWNKGFVSPDIPVQSPTIGHTIFADPNPGGGGCEIYVSGQQADFGSDPNGQVDGYNYLAYKYNRSGTFTSIISGNVSSNGKAPEVSLKQASYLPNYPTGPKLILLGDGQWSNPVPGYWGWNMFVYDISSVAKFPDTEGQVTSDAGNSKTIIIPNPANDFFKVVSDDMISELKISDFTGRPVMRLEPGSNEFIVEVGHLKKGVYVVHTITGNNMNYVRVVIQ